LGHVVAHAGIGGTIRCSPGENAYERGDYRQAVDDFEEAIKIDPSYEQAYMGQGD